MHLRAEYTYRPPYTYLLLGLITFFISIIFGFAVLDQQIWFCMIMSIFSIISFSVSFLFLRHFIKKRKIGNLIVGEDFIEIPVQSDNRVKLNFDEIIEVEIYGIYDTFIQIASEHGIHLIEQNWMKRDDFEHLKNKLQQCAVRS